MARSLIRRYICCSFIDAIHYNVRSEERIVKKAVYIAIGINMDGMKEVLGMWVSENESSKFWLLKMKELKNRGVNDILIICVDGLVLSNAIAAVFLIQRYNSVLSIKLETLLNMYRTKTLKNL